MQIKSYKLADLLSRLSFRRLITLWLRNMPKADGKGCYPPLSDGNMIYRGVTLVCKQM